MNIFDEVIEQKKASGEICVLGTDCFRCKSGYKYDLVSKETVFIGRCENCTVCHNIIKRNTYYIMQRRIHE